MQEVTLTSDNVRVSSLSLPAGRVWRPIWCPGSSLRRPVGGWAVCTPMWGQITRCWHHNVALITLILSRPRCSSTGSSGCLSEESVCKTRAWSSWSEAFHRTQSWTIKWARCLLYWWLCRFRLTIHWLAAVVWFPHLAHYLHRQAPPSSSLAPGLTPSK